MERRRETISAVAEDRRTTVHAAAIEVFAENGFRATSMEKIADRAGMSRPALYQYFDNKEDIFRSALEDAFSNALKAARTELEAPGPLVNQIDGFLQRYHGDLKQRVLSAALGEEFLTFKAQHATDIAESANEQVHKTLDLFLSPLDASGGQSMEQWRDLLVTAPLGFMSGNPSLAGYRRRLRTLAEAVAAGITSQ